MCLISLLLAGEQHRNSCDKDPTYFLSRTEKCWCLARVVERAKMGDIKACGVTRCNRSPLLRIVLVVSLLTDRKVCFAAVAFIVEHSP